MICICGLPQAVSASRLGLLVNLGCPAQSQSVCGFGFLQLCSRSIEFSLIWRSEETPDFETCDCFRLSLFLILNFIAVRSNWYCSKDYSEETLDFYHLFFILFHSIPLGCSHSWSSCWNFNFLFSGKKRKAHQMNLLGSGVSAFNGLCGTCSLK